MSTSQEEEKETTSSTTPMDTPSAVPISPEAATICTPEKSVENPATKVVELQESTSIRNKNNDNNTSSSSNANPNNKPRRRIYRRNRNRRSKTNDLHSIPESISQNKALLSAIQSSLPVDYEFEILKTIHRIHTSKAKHVALQMPEGLLMYACTIADILKKFSVDGLLESVSVLGDVTYGGKCTCS